MKRYIYRNESGRPINVAGYQFTDGGELPSDIIIEQFKEAVSNKFLNLRETGGDKQLERNKKTANTGELIKAQSSAGSNDVQDAPVDNDKLDTSVVDGTPDTPIAEYNSEKSDATDVEKEPSQKKNSKK